MLVIKTTLGLSLFISSFSACTLSWILYNLIQLRHVNQQDSGARDTDQAWTLATFPLKFQSALLWCTAIVLLVCLTQLVSNVFALSKWIQRQNIPKYYTVWIVQNFLSFHILIICILVSLFSGFNFNARAELERLHLKAKNPEPVSVNFVNLFIGLAATNTGVILLSTLIILQRSKRIMRQEFGRNSSLFLVDNSAYSARSGRNERVGADADTSVFTGERNKDGEQGDTDADADTEYLL